jgi:glycosyltransferase involved in cell wall biosynthesis
VRILYFVDGFYAGGKERQLAELLKFITTQGTVEAELVLMSPEMKYPEVLNLGVKIHYLLRRRKKDPLIFLRLYQLCVNFRPDIIHTWDSMTSFYAIPIAKLLGVRLVNGMIRDTPQRVAPFTKSWIRSKITFPFSDVVVANSQAGLSAYKTPPAKSICIFNGFDWARLRRLVDKDIVRSDFGIATPNVVGMVASFSDLKDYDTFLIAAQKVLATRNDVTFVAVGEGGQLERCRSLVAPQYRQNIRFLGWQEDVESIMNIMNIGVLATHTEGISNSILEFMALGKPVVATDGGGTKEIVVHEETGYLVPPRDAAQFASRISELLGDPEKCKEFGSRGRDRVLRLFSIEVMVNQFMGVYERLI